MVDVGVYQRRAGDKMYGHANDFREVEVSADDTTTAQLIAVQLVAATLGDTGAVVSCHVIHHV